MDPVSVVLAALAAGALSGVGDAASSAVRDAYSGLKKILARRLVDVSGVESRPDSLAQRTALEERLTDIPGAVDDELLAAAREVTEAVAAHQPALGTDIGVDLERIRADFLKIRGVESTGTGVRVRDAEVGGGIEIDEVRSGNARSAHPSPRQERPSLPR